jgi:hypothetical protein
MSPMNETLTFRKRFERAAAVLLCVSMTVMVGGGTIMMCMQPAIA